MPPRFRVTLIALCSLAACHGPEAAISDGGSTATGGATGSGHALFPTLRRRSRGVGYIDQSGREVIAPQFDNGRPFRERLGAVERDELWGFIDESGRVVIDFQFGSVGEDFTGGHALVFREGREVIIDRTGHETFAGNIAGYRLSEGLVTIVDASGRYGYATADGQIAVAPRFLAAAPFSEGLAAARTDTGWGYIDPTGSFVIAADARFFRAERFSEGLAFVANADEEGSYIDRSGKVVIPLGQQTGQPFSEGLAAVLENAFLPHVGYIDKSGREVIARRFLYDDTVGVDIDTRFKQGLAMVMVNSRLGETVNDRFAYADHSGQLVIAARFSIAFAFDNGLALVATWEKDPARPGQFLRPFGYIDRSGQFVWRDQ
jgi:hypothetical protein